MWIAWPGGRGPRLSISAPGLVLVKRIPTRLDRKIGGSWSQLETLQPQGRVPALLLCPPKMVRLRKQRCLRTQCASKRSESELASWSSLNLLPLLLSMILTSGDLSGEQHRAWRQFYQHFWIQVHKFKDLGSPVTWKSDDRDNQPEFLMCRSSSEAVGPGI